MRIVQFELDGKTGFGILTREDLENVYTDTELMGIDKFEDLIRLYEKIKAESLEARLKSMDKIDRNRICFKAPTLPTQNVFCIGKNYREHIKEFDGSDKDVKRVEENPIFFTKALSSLCGHKTMIQPHSQLTQCLDYEAELGVVIGKTCRDVSEKEALEYVFGYTIINDVTARDLQMRHQQWFKGKSLDTSCPCGPWLVTADEIENPQNLHITCMVNKEIRQIESTQMMIHSVAKQISILSQGMTLKPGDLIATGTPKGVGKGYQPPKYLKSGDYIQITIESVGTLENTVDVD